MGVHNEKNTYYNLLQKEMKKSYDLIVTSEYNREYSFKMNQFASIKKRRVFDILMGETYDWKFYLLNKLDYGENNEGKWEKFLFDFIENEIKDNEKKIYEKYFLENNIFMNQFTLRNNPSIALTDSEKNHDNSKKKDEKLLSLLNDSEEIEDYYEGRHNKNKKNVRGNPSVASQEFELSKININESKAEDRIEIKDEIKIDESNKQKEPHRKITSSKLNKSDAKLLNKDINEENQNKYYSYQIRRHINLIRIQLEKPKHPLNIIIKKFSEVYTFYINKCYDTINKEDDKKIEETKDNIIKNIQDFIDIISVALKLFYMKSINYDYFEYEKDEFINLICFILFKHKPLVNSLFRFFELSNKKKQEKLNEKKELFKDITPREVGISLKFRLDEDTEKFKNSNAGDIKKNEDSGIVQYFNNLDIEIKKTRTSSAIVVVDENEMVSNYDNSRRMSVFTPDKSSDTNKSFLINKNDIVIYKVREKKKNKKVRIERESIATYSEFSEKFNNLEKPIREKYKEDMFNNPSEFDIYTEKANHDPSHPYENAIKFINKIKDYKFPLDKLTIIAIVSAIITDCVDECWKVQKNKIPDNFLKIDSDELLSIYLFIICKMNTESIYTQLDFIQYFTGTVTKQSMIGYFYTTFEGCLKFLMSIEKKEDFTKNINKKKE